MRQPWEDNEGDCASDTIPFVLLFGFLSVDLRGYLVETRYFFTFPLPVAPSTLSKLKHPDKAQLRSNIIEMRQQKMSLRDIGSALGISFRRVSQILKA